MYYLEAKFFTLIAETRNFLLQNVFFFLFSAKSPAGIHFPPNTYEGNMHERYTEEVPFRAFLFQIDFLGTSCHASTPQKKKRKR